MSELRLSISNLSKNYSNGVRALNSVSLEIEPGLFGLLGPNGAGKTTLMKILATLLDADEGSVGFAGIDLLENKMDARRHLGYLPQDFGLYPDFTAEQMLIYLAKLKGLSSSQVRELIVDALLDRVNLNSARDQKLGTFSGGMRQRFGIAQALLGNPKLIIVDEPTAGLDPVERSSFYNLLAEVAEDVVVILSTHIVADVSSLCTQMAILRQGEIISVRSPSSALSQMDGRVWEARLARSAAEDLKKHISIISSHMVGGVSRVRAISEERPSDCFAPVEATLEDYYFSLINKSARGN